MRQLAISTAYVRVFKLLLKGRWQERERRVELATAYSLVEGLRAKMHLRRIVKRFAITKNPLWENPSLRPLLEPRTYISLFCRRLT